MNAKQIIKLIEGYADGVSPTDQTSAPWFGEAFLEKHSKAMSEIKESSPDLEKTKTEIQKIHDQLTKLKTTIHKEHQSGKGASVLDGLKKQWQSLQDKIVAIWKAYDSKHGTHYAQAYA